MQHEWEPFTEDLVICTQCGTVCDEAVPDSEWNADDCKPDELLTYAVGGMDEEEADRINGFTEGGGS